MPLGIDPKVDFAFKKLFGSPANKMILLDLVNSILSSRLVSPITDLEIQNPFSAKDFEKDKLHVVDILARDQLDRQFLIEMQMVPRNDFLDRAAYYCTRHFSSQLNEGDQYNQLRQTIMINFVNGVFFRSISSHRTTFQLREETHPEVVMTKLIEIHFVELGKFFRSADELSDPLDQWCYLLRNGEDLEPKNLPTNMTSDAIRKAVEVLQNMNMNKEERMIYEARRKAEMDALYYQTSPEQFEEIGRKKGLEEGLLQGLIQGHGKGKIEGKQEGVLLGKLEGMLELKFGDRGIFLAEMTSKIEQIDVIQKLLVAVRRSSSPEEFEAELKRTIPSPG